MKWLLIGALVVLTGCSNLNLRDNLSDAGTAVTTIGCAVLTGGNVPVCASAGIGTGVVINTVTGEPDVNISQVTNEHQEEVAKKQVEADLIQSLTTEGIIGAIVFFGILPIITGWLGLRRKRPEEHRLEAERDLMERMAKDRNEQ